MRVTSLVENHSSREDCGCIHGLSLDIVTEKHHLLFDVGPNALFLENAKALGIDVSTADLCFLSHGHYDHGGGLELFCKRNERAKVLVAKGAFEPHAVLEDGNYTEIGVLPRVQLAYPDRFMTVSGSLDAELFVFSDIRGEDYVTAASKSLLEKTETGYQPDRFFHEQNLIVTASGVRVLFAGCAHRGIVNILRRGEEIVGGELDYVFSGFHLTNPVLNIDEPRELIEAVGRELAARKKTQYVTGHCTGDRPYEILSEMLQGRLSLMAAGCVFELKA